MGGVLAELDRDPHPLLARLREQAPVSWMAELGGWLVTGHAQATAVLLDPATFTVDDSRFTTARITGLSMLSLDGTEHARHREPFAHAFMPAEVTGRLAGVIQAQSCRLVDAIRPAGQAELRQSFAGPLAAAVMAEALGLASVGVTPDAVLAWYREIVAVVSALPASGSLCAPGEATPQSTPRPREPMPVASFTELAASVREAMKSGHAPVSQAGSLSADEVISNAAVALFGGIETMEGMICNAVVWTGRMPGSFGLVSDDVDLVPGAVEESLRMEPAAAVVDRYATRDVTIAGASIRGGDFVRVSITGANRDPAVFAEPDRFDMRRPGVGRHLAFARGPHFCIGAHLARLEAVTAVTTLVSELPGLRLNPDFECDPRGLVFRKPDALHVRWNADSIFR